MNNTPQLLSIISLGVEEGRPNERMMPSPAASHSAASIRKRRNGLTPACEPCRKAKVRCDSSPLGTLCSRCRKRKTSEKCIFLEAPMTRQYREVSNAPGASLPPPKSSSLPRNGSTALSPSSAIGSFNGSISRKAAGPSGFLGQTSFSATIHVHDGDDDESCDECENSNSIYAMDPAEVTMGLNVLRVLPGYDDCQTVLKKYLEGPCEVGFLKPSIQNVLDSLFVTYGSRLKEPRTDSELEEMSEAITRKSVEVLVLSDSAPGWIAAFSGKNTRWESMGILLAALASGVLAVHDREFMRLGLSSRFTEKKKAVLAIKEGVELCLELCRHNLNTLICHLLYKNLLLETVLHGDSSK